MSTGISENANNDMYLDATGQVAFVSGLAALVIRCRAAMEVFLGECVLDTTRGLPTEECLQIKYKPAQWIAAGRRTLASVLGSEGSVKSLTVTREKHTFSYTAEIETIYGSKAIYG